MSDFRLGVIYTSVTDSWGTLTEILSLSREQIVLLNPHLDGCDVIEAGVPINIPVSKRRNLVADRIGRFRGIALSAYGIAHQEFLLDVKERPGGEDNPRIVLYHSTTSDGAMPDSVPWCSSFVNFCVEQAGGIGTDSKVARSWLKWGNEVPRSDWQRGDIVVFRRGTSGWQGHVAFIEDISGGRPMVLGGNQSGRVSIDDPYPFDSIISVRRM